MDRMNEKSFKVINTELIHEWHPTKNGLLKPYDVKPYSEKRVWWIGKCGHEWEASIKSRSAGSGCPYCANQKVLKGFNDLATKNPIFLEEWDYEKNVMKPSEIVAGSTKKVWWRCKNCKNEWEASVSNRNNGSGCPYCSGKIIKPGFNDLNTMYPNIAKEWDFVKNKELPDSVAPHSAKKYWWICSKGHSFLMSIDKRTGSEQSNCPYCSNQKVLAGFNDLQTIYPEIAKEWDFEKNYPKMPETVAKKSNMKAWWICSKCNRSFMATVYNRVAGHGCPYCANQLVIAGDNDLLSLFPEIAKEWDYDKNDLLPNAVLSKTHRKVWWLCPEGHSYQATVSSRTGKNTGCPICKGLIGTSFQEQAILYYLAPYVEVKSRYVINDQEIDIYLPDYKIGIEYDGYYYHSSERSKIKERQKNNVIASLGINLYRVKESKTKDYSNPG